MKYVRIFTGFGQCLLLSILFTSHLHAQWNPVEGIEEAYIQKVVIMDSLMIAAPRYNGIYIKDHQGEEWNQVVSGINCVDMKKAASVVVALSWPNLHRSFDQGQTWDTVPIMNGIVSNTFATLDSFLFMTGYNDVFRSDDFGQTFFSVKNNLPDIFNCNVFANNNTVILYSNSTLKMYISEDWGFSWVIVNMEGFPIGISYNSDIFRYDNRLWFAGYHTLLWINLVSGGWHAENDSLSFEQFGVFNGTLHACGFNGFYRYNPLDNQWVLLNEGIDYQNILTFDAVDNVILAGSSTGPFTCDDSYQWEESFHGFNLASLWKLVCESNDVWALTAKYLYHSTDQGNTFNRIDLSQYSPLTNVVFSESVIYLTCHNHFLISYDQGSNWQIVVPPPPEVFMRLGVNQEYIYSTSQNNFFRANLHEIDWHTFVVQDLDYPGDLAVHDSILIVTGLPDFTGPDNPVHISRDHGVSFTPLYQFSDADEIPCISYQDNTFIVFHLVPFLSDDGGETWTSIPFYINQFDANYLAYRYPMMAVSGYSNNQGFCMWTSDHGTSWTDITGNLNTGGYHPIRDVALSESRLFASVGSGGLWYREDVVTGAAPLEQNIHSGNFTLYPNPTSGLVTLFTGSNETGGKISIFDYLGHLKSATIIAPGKIHENLDISDLDPGIYMILLQIEKQPRTSKKLIIY